MNDEITAWVESPLQLLGALEHAALNVQQRRVTIVPRGGDAQLEYTAAHLADRVSHDAAMGARIAIDVRVMPRGQFAPGGHWVVGDAFSGQVQARLDRAVPATLTLVDDGAITRLLAHHLVMGSPLLRPRAPRLFATFRRDLAERTTNQLLALAQQGRLNVTTYLSADDPAISELRSIGAVVTSHRFDVTRRHGERASGIPLGSHIVLGTARVADGLTDAVDELRRIEALARRSPIAYLPHRREPDWFVAAVGRVPNTTVALARLPIELALAGTERPLDITVGASTAAETLAVVLRGTGSTLSAHSLVGREIS